MQSMQPEVLEVIKRKNLPIEVARNMSEELQTDNVGFFSELIAGLPEQTFDGHLNDNRVLMDLNANTYNYNLRLLFGTEMNTDESRQKYVLKSGWRLTSDAFGVYDGTPVFEGEEVVLATPTMSESEIHQLRLIHFLLMYMWGKGFFLDYLQLFRTFKHHPMDVILAVADAIRSDAKSTDPGTIGSAFLRFEADHALEKFASYEELCSYWSEEEPQNRLRRGELGKLNSSHGLELISNADAFLWFLRDVAKNFLGKDWPVAEPLFSDVLRFTKLRIVDVSNPHEAPLIRVGVFSWDIAGWRTAGYQPEIPIQSREGEYSVEFYRDQAEVDRLSKSFSFFSHENTRATLRTMFDMRASYFLYHTRPLVEAVAAE